MASPNGTTSKTDRLAFLPQDVRERILAELSSDSIDAFSAFDLASHGQYTTGYLVLGDNRLGQFVQSDGQWRGEWLNLGKLEEARVIEGLGMNLLRLTRDGKVLAEYRFTNRHAKTMAEIHTQIERRITGEEAAGNGPPDRDEGDEEAHHDKKLYCDKCGSMIPDWAETCPRCLHQRKVLMRLLEFVRPHRWRAIWGFALALGVLGVNMLRPLINKQIVDGAIKLQNVSLLKWLIGAWAAILVAEAVFEAARAYLLSGLGMRVAAELRDQCYAHLHRLSLAYFSRKATASLITRVTSHSDRVWDFVAFNLVDTVMAFVTFVSVGILMIIVNWRLAALVLIPIPLMLFMMSIFHKRMHEAFERIWHKWSVMTSVVADALPGVRVIKAFNQERREIRRFHDRNYQVYDAEQRLANAWTFFGPAMMLSSQIAFLIIWGVGGVWAIRDYVPEGHPVPPGAMTLGTLVAFTGLMWMFFQPIHQIAHMSRMFNRAATSVQRIFEVLDTEPDVFTKRNSKPLKQLQGHIEFRNVSFSYDGIRRVLRNINLEVQPGEMIGLVGASGSGKTTLINLLCRFYDPQDGQIFIDGEDIRDYDLEDLRRFTGVVLQDPYLFRGTVAENVAYGKPSASVLEILQAARTANVHNAIVGFPDGYDTVVGERGQTLSGGERQRVSIARAILNNPRLLILDEATSNVDTHTEKLIQEALDHLISNRTTIAIAHRLSTLRKANRLVVLDKGKIVEEGTHAELESKSDGIYAKLLHMQTEMKSLIALQE